MACPQQSGNTISFDIPDNYKASVIVCFTGTFQKQVIVQWGDGNGKIWNSCDEEIIEGISYSVQKENNLKRLLQAEVIVSYQDLPCDLAPEPASWLPIPMPALLVQNCNPIANPIVVGGWLFTAPNLDTVQITIVVDEQFWTGDNPEPGQG